MSRPAPTPTTPTLLLVGGARGVSLSVDMARCALARARARGLRTHVTGRPDTLAATPQVAAQADAVSAVDFSVPGETAACGPAPRSGRQMFKGYVAAVTPYADRAGIRRKLMGEITATASVSVVAAGRP